MKLFVGGLGVAVVTSVASAGFVIEVPPTDGGSWTQHIVAAGPFDYLGFEFLEGTGGPFQPPGLSGFVDHSAGFPPPIVATWTVVADHLTDFVLEYRDAAGNVLALVRGEAGGDAAGPEVRSP